MSRWFVFLIFFIALGCQSNPDTSRALDTQRQYITEIDNRVKKVEANMQRLKEENEQLSRELKTIKDHIKKTSPGYAEGGIQEGTK